MIDGKTWADQILQGWGFEPVEEPMKYQRENVTAALEQAIKSLKGEEERLGFKGDAALLAGWKLMLDDLRSGKLVEITVKDRQ